MSERIAERTHEAHRGEMRKLWPGAVSASLSRLGDKKLSDSALPRSGGSNDKGMMLLVAMQNSSADENKDVGEDAGC